MSRSIDVFNTKFMCPYFDDGREMFSQNVMIDENNGQLYSKLIGKGYRRSGNLYYRVLCEDCNECISIRIPVDKFAENKSQRRVAAKNHDLKVVILEKPELTNEKIALYRKYSFSKHARNDGYDDDMQNLIALHYLYPRILEFNYYYGDRLIAVGIVDETDDSLSSNYFYYDTDFNDRSPGVFSILREIEAARVLGKKYYYLGFYIEKCRKMTYKSKYYPNEILDENNNWVEFITG